MKTVGAFLKRDFRAAWSYRFSFVTQAIGLVFSLASLRLLANLFQHTDPGSLRPYGGDYFSFVLIGSALSILSYPVTKAFADGVRSAQVNGTFEAMLTTQANPIVLVLSSGAYAVLMALLEGLVALLIGVFLFGAGLHVGHLLLDCLVLLLTLASLIGTGLASAAFVIAFQQSEPISSGLVAASFLLGGVLYPVSVLPKPLAWLGQLLPLTHAIELARGLLITTANVESLVWHFLALCAFSLLLPVGVVLLALALQYAKQAGTLAHY